MTRLPHVISVEPLSDYRLRLVFDDGVKGDVDLADLLWGPMFEPLKDPAKFAQVRVEPETGTITWPNGADLDPCALHDAITTSPSSAT